MPDHGSASLVRSLTPFLCKQTAHDRRQHRTQSRQTQRHRRKHLGPLHDSAQEHPPEISEVDGLGLSVLPGAVVDTPRLAAAPVSPECRFHSVTPFGDTGAAFLVGEGGMFHIRDGLLQDGKIDTALLRPICRIGGPNYASLGPIVTKRGIQQTPKSTIKPEAA
jgi:flavin reductase (DIM6/NTAB) family NADH-FMN oxidoreductase RutF